MMRPEVSSENAPPLPEARRDAAQECAAIEADLDRLQRLFNDAASRLLASFHEVAALESGTLRRSDDERRRFQDALGSAITALQFQDMASQLTGHAQRRLLALEARLQDWCGDPAQGITVEHPHPVRQAEMASGSVELF
ncbi:uncharacterized protein E1O_23880 [Burkholderiales bacterium GJ-E10]|nr:uncharacterized protein E1O_23880 [Burkholderiales bacterium GJ-E10]